MQVKITWLSLRRINYSFYTTHDIFRQLELFLVSNTHIIYHENNQILENKENSSTSPKAIMLGP